MLTKELLLSVMKPARYIGCEIGAIKKDLSKMAVKVCLCFPDTYEIGMSHLGLRILYDLINKRDDCVAERLFSPWIDMEAVLRNNKIPLFSLESQAEVKNFDILGFSLQYELSYTNVLNILSLSDVPLLSAERSERGEDCPIIIAGGNCCLNPEPMADFIDAFVVGEAEEVIIEIIESFKQYKAKGAKNRMDFLKELSLIEGIYVPFFHKAGEPFKVRKRVVKDLEKALDLDCWVVPYIGIVHDRVALEIMRGCPNSCRFCQARNSFYPLRIVSEKKIVETARKLCKTTGYEEISLLSLSSSDHPSLKNIIKILMEDFKDKGINISLPSLRVKTFLGELSEMFSNAKKTSLTFAPEAGSERLRQLINKNISIDELFDVSKTAYKAGYRLLKLYFMIGLPTETDEDLDEIVNMSFKLSQLKKEIDGHPAHLNVSISNFIPKPHTPFQWEAFASRDEILRKQEYLKKAFNRKAGHRGVINVKFHNPATSFIEGVFSRGDRRLCNVVKDAFIAGARFDAWDSMPASLGNFVTGFNISLWMEAFSKNSIDVNEYLRARDYSDNLSWDFIDIGIQKEYFINEDKKALGKVF